MNSKIKAIGVTALAGFLGLAAVAPAVARPMPWIPPGHPGMHSFHHYHQGYQGHFHRYYGSGYSYSPGYYGYGYPGYYGYGYDPGAGIAAGVIGGVFGAIAGEALTHGGGHSHIWRCEHAYRSYVPATNTFTGNNGHKYICRL